MKEYSLLVANHEPTGNFLQVLAPFSGEVIAKMECANERTIENALTVAYKLYKNRKSWLPLTKRIEILEKLIKLMQDKLETLAIDAAREGGKPLIDSRAEAMRAIDGIKICIETMRSEAGTVIPMQYNAASANRIALTQKEPIGVVVAVSAFNHPLNLIVHQVGAAVAAGCPVIVKPAGDTPISCMNFVNLLYTAGLPDEWCQAVVIKDNDLAQKLVTDQRVGFFSFIGSARVGWMLQKKLAPGTRCSLEHGGVAPVIVAKDADWEKTVPALMKGGFYHAGQVCVSVQRIFADHTIAEKLAASMAVKAKKLKIGDPTLADTEVGPLIRHTEVTRVNEWVQEAVGKGANVLSGGSALSDSCYHCTVLYNPPADIKLSQLEVFGPVVCVYSYDEIDTAIAQANSLDVAFQAAVFTENIDTAMHAYKQLDASAVMINDHTAFRVDGMPFAGLRHSGLGVGGIPYTIHDMQIEKMMVLKSSYII